MIITYYCFWALRVVFDVLHAILLAALGNLDSDWLIMWSLLPGSENLLEPKCKSCWLHQKRIEKKDPKESKMPSIEKMIKKNP